MGRDPAPRHPACARVSARLVPVELSELYLLTARRLGDHPHHRARLVRTDRDYEQTFGCTIQRGRSIRVLAGRGIPFAAALAQPDLAQRALSPGWNEPVLTQDWHLPTGAHGDTTGPF